MKNLILMILAFIGLSIYCIGSIFKALGLLVMLSPKLAKKELQSGPKRSGL